MALKDLVAAPALQPQALFKAKVLLYQLVLVLGAAMHIHPQPAGKLTVLFPSTTTSPTT